MNTRITQLLAVAIGGSLGTLFRFTINSFAQISDFPFATVIENCSGSLLLGLLVGWLSVRTTSGYVKLFFGTGMLGSFSTMSTFAADSFMLGLAHAWGQAVFYVMVSLLGAIILAAVGYHIGRKAGRRHRGGNVT